MSKMRKVRRYAAFLLACVMMLMSAMTSMAESIVRDGGWSHDLESDKWYYYKDGEMVVSSWIEENGKWYWVGEDGVMVIGWFDTVDDNNKQHTSYAKSPHGDCVAGDWYYIDNKWYYFNGATYLVKNDWIKWKKDDKWYYLGEDGVMVTNTWVTWQKNDYYLNDKGIMETDKWLPNDTTPTYYVGPDGVKAKNAIILKKDGTRAYVNAEGIFDANFIGSVTVNGITYSIENGYVHSIDNVEAATSSNASRADVELLKDLLQDNAVQADDKPLVADKIVQAVRADEEAEHAGGVEKIVADQKAAEDMDVLLKDAYGNRLDLVKKADDDTNDVSIKGDGLIVASGYTSNTPLATASNATKVELVMTASPADAEKGEMDFDLKLKVNGEITELQAPIYLTLEIPKVLAENPSRYTYRLEHEGKPVENADFSNVADRVVSFRADSFSKFTLIRELKSSSSSGGTSSGGSSRSTVVPTGQWVKAADGIRWWYRNPDGTWPANGWAQLTWNGKLDWYYFDAEGYMVTGWITWDGNRYYLHPLADNTQGYMYTGWKMIDGKYYYFRPESGGPQGSLFVNGTTPDGYRVDANGVWIQ